MMWDFGNHYSEGRNSSAPMASLHAMHEIHVLLVDHEPEALIQTAKQLELCQYRVTLVELASAAISMLLSGKTKFDVVIANINSPDLHGFKLLQQALTMGLPIVFMSIDDNAFMAMRALESGAFLFIKKPATIEILRYLWQLVMREKTRMFRERELFLAANNVHINNGGQIIENPNFARGFEVRNENEIMNHSLELMSAKNKKKARDDEECDSDNNNIRKKMCTEWTHELHARFMNAVETLGEGRCFPKEILELMNVPGLTRMQVASHLQKCRNDNWKSPEERKPVSTIPQATHQDTNIGSQPRPRRFGSKPLVGKTNSDQVQVQTQETGQGSGNRSITETPNVENESTPTFAYHHKKYGSIGGSGPRYGVPRINSSSNHRHSSDEFFNFPDTNFLIQNLTGEEQGVRTDHPNSGPGAPQFEPAPYNEKQNSETSMETRSHWSSDTSNFESDHSETRGPN